MRFFFDVQTGDTVVADAEGIKFTSSAEAHHQAVLAAREMMAERLPWGATVGRSPSFCHSRRPWQLHLGSAILRRHPDGVTTALMRCDDDHTLRLGTQQLRELTRDLERLLAALSEDAPPGSSALAEALHNVANMEMSVNDLQQLMDRSDQSAIA